MADTKRAFVTGWPVDHSRSPLIHSYWLDKHGFPTDDPSLVVVLSHQLGAADVPHARELANPPVDVDTLPFDPLEYIDYELPWDGLDAD